MLAVCSVIEATNSKLFESEVSLRTNKVPTSPLDVLVILMEQFGAFTCRSVIESFSTCGYFRNLISLCRNFAPRWCPSFPRSLRIFLVQHICVITSKIIGTRVCSFGVITLLIRFFAFWGPWGARECQPWFCHLHPVCERKYDGPSLTAASMRKGRVMANRSVGRVELKECPHVRILFYVLFYVTLLERNDDVVRTLNKGLGWWEAKL